MSIVERIEQLGIRVTAEDGHIVLEGNTGALTPEQVAWVREHKPAILQELRSRVVAKLGSLAKRHHLPMDELLDWYRGDIEDMTRLSDETLTWLVEDYAALRESYRRYLPVSTMREAC